jgi:hypothetical protein
MSFVNVSPELVASAGQSVAGIGSALDQAHAAAASTTTSVVAAAEDEVSTAIAAVFRAHGHTFNAASAQMSNSLANFTSALQQTAHAYNSAESANNTLVQSVIDAFHITGIQIFPPTQSVYFNVGGYGWQVRAAGQGTFYVSGTIPPHVRFPVEYWLTTQTPLPINAIVSGGETTVYYGPGIFTEIRPTGQGYHGKTETFDVTGVDVITVPTPWL